MERTAVFVCLLALVPLVAAQANSVDSVDLKMSILPVQEEKIIEDAPDELVDGAFALDPSLYSLTKGPKVNGGFALNAPLKKSTFPQRVSNADCAGGHIVNGKCLRAFPKPPRNANVDDNMESPEQLTHSAFEPDIHQFVRKHFGQNVMEETQTQLAGLPGTEIINLTMNNQTNGAADKSDETLIPIGTDMMTKGDSEENVSIVDNMNEPVEKIPPSVRRKPVSQLPKLATPTKPTTTRTTKIPGRATPSTVSTPATATTTTTTAPSTVSIPSIPTTPTTTTETTTTAATTTTTTTTDAPVDAPATTITTQPEQPKTESDDLTSTATSTSDAPLSQETAPTPDPIVLKEGAAEIAELKTTVSEAQPADNIDPENVGSQGDFDEEPGLPATPTPTPTIDYELIARLQAEAEAHAREIAACVVTVESDGMKCSDASAEENMAAAPVLIQTTEANTTSACRAPHVKLVTESFGSENIRENMHSLVLYCTNAATRGMTASNDFSRQSALRNRYAKKLSKYSAVLSCLDSEDFPACVPEEAMRIVQSRPVDGFWNCF